MQLIGWNGTAGNGERRKFAKPTKTKRKRRKTKKTKKTWEREPRLSQGIPSSSLEDNWNGVCGSKCIWCCKNGDILFCKNGDMSPDTLTWPPFNSSSRLFEGIPRDSLWLSLSLSLSLHLFFHFCVFSAFFSFWVRFVKNVKNLKNEWFE